jgi:hypothetical protein
MTKPFVKALFVVAVPSDETPVDARLGLRIRLQAAISGRCACGGTAKPTGDIQHEADCPAISETVTRAIRNERVHWVAVPGLVPFARYAHAQSVDPALIG